MYKYLIIIISIITINFSPLAYPKTDFNAIPIPDNLIKETKEYKLSNGLKLIIKKDSRAPVVITQIWYNVGASYEHNGITGLSHLLEHLMFNESKNLKKGEFNKIIALNGGINNAFTTKDQTVYYETLSADKLELTLKLEAERMQNLILDPKNIANEKNIVLEERRLRTDNNPNSKAYEVLNYSAHVSSPYHHPTIGWENDIKNYTTANIQNWYDSWYQPNNAVIVIVGDIDFNKTLNLTKKYFANIKSKKLPILKPRPEQQQLGNKTIQLNLPAATPTIMMGYLTPAFGGTDGSFAATKDILALELLSLILTSDNSSLLYNQLVNKKQMASAISTYFEGKTKRKTLFIIHANPYPKISLTKLKQAIFTELEKLQKNPIDINTLNKVKIQFLSNKIYMLDDIENQAMTLGLLENIGLGWKYYKTYYENLKKITPEDIQQAIKKYLISNNSTAIFLHKK